MTSRGDHTRAMHNLVHCLWMTCGRPVSAHRAAVCITPIAYPPVGPWG
jgi:hypothetical protein